MKRTVLITCLLATVLTTKFATGYVLCGDDTQNDEVDAARDEIVRRLMTLRDSEWGWEAVLTPTALQVASPKMFFGRNYTAKRLETIIEQEFDEFGIEDKVEYSFAARALCMDPTNIGGRNLLDNIHEYLLKSEENMNDLPHYTMSLGALCLNNYPIEKSLINVLLKAQNDDGSFGPSEEGGTIQVTIWILRPMWCFSQMKNATFDTSRVLKAVLQMRKFIIRYIRKSPNPQVYIGKNEDLAIDALVGLWKSVQPGEDPSTWYCDGVMNILGVKPRKDDEDEYDLQERLMFITGTDYLDLQSKDYKCIETDPIPPGYKPTCNYKKPETCGNPAQRGKVTEILVLISVSLIYFTNLIIT